MAVSEEFRTFVLEALEGFGPVTAKRMFGGIGLFADGLMFGLMTSEDLLYLKADEASSGAYEAEGKAPFHYTRPNGKSFSMSYWEVPERLYDEPEELCEWARGAYDVALKADAAKPASKRKRARVT